MGCPLEPAVSAFWLDAAAAPDEAAFPTADPVGAAALALKPASFAAILAFAAAMASATDFYRTTISYARLRKDMRRTSLTAAGFGGSATGSEAILSRSPFGGRNDGCAYGTVISSHTVAQQPLDSLFQLCGWPAIPTDEAA